MLVFLSVYGFSSYPENGKPYEKCTEEITCAEVWDALFDTGALYYNTRNTVATKVTSRVYTVISKEVMRCWILVHP